MSPTAPASALVSDFLGLVTLRVVKRDSNLKGIFRYHQSTAQATSAAP